MTRLLSNLFPALLWATLTFISLTLRPLFPIDETRYAAVAWEMWVRDDFLVPYLNGEAYSHKPPLLFWLMQLSWWLFGVNDWSLRIIAPLFSLAALYLSSSVAKVLWPGRKLIAELAPLVLLGLFFWMVYGTLTMFDVMLGFFVLLGIYVLATMIQSGLALRRTLLLGLAIGGGVLTKGPVILLHVLPLALLSPFFLLRQEAGLDRKKWFLNLLLAVIVGAAIALCWAIPAGLAGGEAYRNAIFLGQTSGRLVDSFAHKLPWWWYLELLPFLLLPWVLVKPVWLGLAKFNKDDFGCRFCLLWAMPVFIAFSLVSGKRIHYLLPLMPAVALIIAWALDRAAEPGWRRPQQGLAVVQGALGLLLMLLPWLNTVYPFKVDMAQLSPIWGVLLLVSAFGIALRKSWDIRTLVQDVCISGVILGLVLVGGFFEVQHGRYDMTPPAKKIAELMRENRSISYFGGKYHGQFNFPGRLTQPIMAIPDKKGLLDFAHRNPTGYVIVEYHDSLGLSDAIVAYHFYYKNHNVGLVSSESLLLYPQFVAKLLPA